MAEITTVKQRFGIIGNSPLLDRALEVALRVAPTDLTVLVTGESGVGKEFFPQVIHAYSARKHSKYIAVNCAAIPEGTIDSELFGHEKGSFTGAVEARKGYFEEADGGTIFLDEVAELPHPTQARLLRVLQTGEYIRVGSSKVQKTNVRVVAATNMNLQEAIAQGRFREDLYYRLGTVPITVPSLRERPEDISLLFRKFAADVAVQYRMPAVTLDDAAREMLRNYYWRGNIRQLKNVAEQISAIEQTRVITSEVLAKYLPPQGGGAPMHTGPIRMDDSMSTERELLYKVLFDMRADINDLKRMISELMKGTAPCAGQVHDVKALLPTTAQSSYVPSVAPYPQAPVYAESEEVTDEPPREMTKADMQREQIIRALRRNNGRRREAAAELFMSERTLYRKIKELGIEEN
ncbi:sigma-54 dependent transcriptional regulator [Alistipes sp.]|uniref:sigma-54 interaction domain-containing protein n=1 Tax=Alistipes sp. TaxID=1872444 RepID=UPI0025C25CB1|nr:sigma-54 dependent transcriptional regulator [Alistipes sp.]